MENYKEQDKRGRTIKITPDRRAEGKVKGGQGEISWEGAEPTREMEMVVEELDSMDLSGVAIGGF